MLYFLSEVVRCGASQKNGGRITPPSIYSKSEIYQTSHYFKFHNFKLNFKKVRYPPSTYFLSEVVRKRVAFLDHPFICSKSEMIELFLCDARRQIRSILGRM